MERNASRDAEVASRLKSGIEEYEKRLHERRSADVKRGMRVRAERGEHVSRVPIGYRKVWRDDSFVIEADPVQAPLVYQAFMMAAGRHSIRQLHAKLKCEGLRLADGRVPSASCVFRLLRNRFYLGEVRAGSGTVPGLHPALIDADTFSKASSGSTYSR